ncbi:hypothetical protein K431DRAFT_316978 [Polychaeton citri CBS 116435]|uniref:D-arabinono-1,4-lactone oxidase n=1 Tax=Polychaeton citri CBS 116435 TaxID=1314669 RepID=A0A9P4QGK5_9PEZI|nr:hypothetical protein K431DRAFT_316978 [Polychaeton citri CBS 116435]
MDPKIQAEVDRTEPDVPFRASTSHLHHTWARTFQSRPELYLQPHTLAEVQKIVTLARKCRRRLVVVGCGHSPSDLTCTSSWMVNLDHLNRILKVDSTRKKLLVEGGIRMRDLNAEAAKHGLTMPNLGSIHDQSITGAISTATHGSSLQHGLLSEDVTSLRIVLSNGQAVRCSAEQNPDLFRAALVSLGALGIIVELEFQMADACNIEWKQTLRPLSDILARWETDLWTQKEYTRVWWMPYMKRGIIWSAEKTEKAEKAPQESWYGGSVGFYTYHNLLWLSNYVPSILPWVEWFVFGMQYGFRTDNTTTAVEPLRTGLLMNCLYSQFVNEWAIPLRKGPEAITRLSAWINREPGAGDIPFDNTGLYVHCPVEVRVSNTFTAPERRGAAYAKPFLDNAARDGPTLYLNATLYRPYLRDPPCRDRYYEAFEWLMKEMGGQPHWAKNFTYTDKEYVGQMLGEEGRKWAEVRDEADPEGMFLGEWHKRNLPLGEMSRPLHEREVKRAKAADGGQFWQGAITGRGLRLTNIKPLELPARQGSGSESDSVSGFKPDTPSVASSSGESFDMMHGAEAEKSVLYDGNDEPDARYHGHPQSGITGTQVFDKM